MLNRRLYTLLARVSIPAEQQLNAVSMVCSYTRQLLQVRLPLLLRCKVQPAPHCLLVCHCYCALLRTLLPLLHCRPVADFDDGAGSGTCGSYLGFLAVIG